MVTHVDKVGWPSEEKRNADVGRDQNEFDSPGLDCMPVHLTL